MLVVRNCEICGRDKVQAKRELHVDHNHETGKIRGVLCFHCNLLIGFLERDLSVLPKAIEYLERGQA